ncbi:MAG: cytochrome c [Candidatus Korobacteraceae bacterium]
MQIRARGSSFSYVLIVLAAVLILWVTPTFAQQPNFRNAPASAAGATNPYAGNAAAAAAGGKLYAQDCAQCHGNHRQGMGPAPALDTVGIHKVKSGELFWFISTGKLTSGMPSWSNLPKQQRWQLVTFLQSPSNEKTAGK